LLVSTSKQMPLCVKELDKRHLDFPVIIGGAAINRSYGRRILFVDDLAADTIPRTYEPGVFYARDAFEGLDIMDKLTNSPEARIKFVQHNRQEALNERTKKREKAEQAVPVVEIDLLTPSSSIKPALSLPKPPFWGPRILERIGLEDVAACMDYKTLYRLHWGGKSHGEEFDQLVKQDFEPRLERMMREARQQRYLQPKVIYGYYPCQSSGNEVLIYDPVLFQRDGTLRELERFSFPRQAERERLCLADYFASVQSGQVDVVPLQVVTMGQPASNAIQALQDQGNYSEAYFLHGLAVEMAEGLAEYSNRLIRHELGVEQDESRGRRFSWGYAAIPELADHAKLFKLLPVEQSIGVHLTEAYQFDPEQTTAAIVIHHQQAVYFAVRAQEEAIGV